MTPDFPETDTSTTTEAGVSGRRTKTRPRTLQVRRAERRRRTALRLGAVALSGAYLLQSFVFLPYVGIAIVLSWSLLVPGYAVLHHRRRPRPQPLETIAASVAISLLTAWLTITLQGDPLLLGSRLLAVLSIALLLRRGES